MLSREDNELLVRVGADAPMGKLMRLYWLPFLPWLAAAPLLTAQSPYTTVLLIDLLIAALFAASLHFIMGPAGMHSFGHAAYFGVGAYAAALLVLRAGVSSEAALLLAPLVSALVAAPITLPIS